VWTHAASGALALQAELFLADRALLALKTERIQAPLYRLPIGMFSRAVPKLIGEGLRHCSDGPYC
jgi:hypothetical protein